MLRVGNRRLGRAIELGQGIKQLVEDWLVKI